MQNKIDYRSYLDNQNMCILEIVTSLNGSVGLQKNYEWLMLSKADCSIKLMSLKSRDDGAGVQERYFNLGYLKFNPQAGVFIESGNKGQHTLENKEDKGLPKEYMEAVEDFLSVHCV